jgi:dTDP-4-amino-4,6-dideoxygalactose transaminase
MAVTDSVSERLLRLPLYFDLGKLQVARIVAAIAQFFDGRSA